MSNPIQAPGNYPTPSWQPAQPAVQGPPPVCVVNAFRAMLASVALLLISVVVTLRELTVFRNLVHEPPPHVDVSSLESSMSLDTAAVVFGIVISTLYVLLALQVRKGKNWARIVTFMFVGLELLTVPFGLAGPAPTVTRDLRLATLVLDVAIIVLLAQRPAAEYFKRQR
jgi:hypothetical protein